ncbi:hypothetical protein SDC9_92742 [bioreactor metagenome]|uniref:Uncharacterized protein n=1 Tax=bioreactor metagenome TaxID=1076179 RepID=A0A645A014_9ZZZZ
MMRLGQQLGDGVALHAAQAGSLCAAAALGQRFREVGEQHREPQPQRDQQDKPRRCLALPTQRLNPQQGGEDRTQVHHKHDGVAPLRTRCELAE